jgi:hypothetical protein
MILDKSFAVGLCPEARNNSALLSNLELDPDVDLKLRGQPCQEQQI